MSSRNDIIGGSEINYGTTSGLVYTCKCGWLDLGHAWFHSSRPNQSAANLWKQVKSEEGEKTPNNLWFKVTYEQLMSKFGASRGTSIEFAVKLGISKVEQEQVALGIFMMVSLAFEKVQGEAQYAWYSDSSFSAEDLVSNLVGFYRAVRPGHAYIKMCEPVSKEAALKIWDGYGAVGRSIYKVREFRPLFFPCSECPNGVDSFRMGRLPDFLNTIIPAPLGSKYRIWDLDDPELSTVPGTPAAPLGHTLPLKPGDTLSGIAKSEYGTFDLWPLVWDQNPSVTVGGNPNKLKSTGTVVLAPLSSFSAVKIADAKKRAPTWRNYPL
jgi:LysM repeat protein